MVEGIVKSDSTAMLHYMPEIIWHDRNSLLSVDFQPQHDGVDFYKVEINFRIWFFPLY